MNETPRRPWWRLHSATWAAISLLGASLLFAGSYSIVHSLLYWRRWSGVIGWPRTFLLLDDSDNAFEGKVFLIGDGVYLSPFTMLGDVAIVSATFAGSAFTVEQACRRHALEARISLRSLLIITATSASFVAISDGAEWTYMLGLAGHFVLYAGIFLAWMAFFELLGIAWSRLTCRRRATEASEPESPPPPGKPR